MAAQSKEDRISMLPDEILVNILSRIPISDGCRTGSLSTRWKNLWTQVSSVCFFGDYDDIVVDNIRPENGFFSFVDSVLNRCSSSKIDRFWVQFQHRDDRDSSPVTRWVQFAVDRNADDIVLMQQAASHPITLPEILVSYLPIRRLKLKCFIIGDHVINWPFLQTLSLRCMKLNNEQVQRLLAGCPVMETLELSYYGFFRELRLTSARLNKLILESCFPIAFDFSDPWLDIYAPHLQHLEIYGSADCRLLDASSLVDAKFDCEMNLYHFKDFLAGSSHAKRLCFSPWLTEALSTLEFNELSTIKFECKQLALHGYITNYNISGIATFLLVLPHLDTLDIYLGSMTLFAGPLIFIGADCYDSNFNPNTTRVNNMNELSNEPWNFNLRLNNLKEVKISHSYCCCSKGRFHYREELLQFAEFVLSKATNLERLCLVSRKGWQCSECLRNCGFQFFSQLATQLHHSPKLSSATLIHLS